MAEVYRRLAATELDHARVWEKKLRDARVEPLSFKQTWRTRMLILLARRFGAQAVIPMIMLARLEQVRW